MHKFIQVLFSDSLIKVKTGASSNDKCLDCLAECLKSVLSPKWKDRTGNLHMETVAVPGNKGPGMHVTTKDRDFDFIQPSYRSFRRTAYNLLCKDCLPQGDTTRLIAVLLWFWMENNDLNDSKLYQNILQCDSVHPYHELYIRLTNRTPSYEGKSWNTIYSSAQTLVEYIFNVTQEGDFLPEQVFDGWLGIPDVAKKKILRRCADPRLSLYSFAKELVDTITHFPLWNYLFKNAPSRHRNAICEILKRITHTDPSGHLIQVRAPVKSIIHYMRDDMTAFCQNKTYTCEDLMLVAGKCAEDTQAYSFGIESPTESGKYRVNTACLDNHTIFPALREIPCWNELREDIKSGHIPFLDNQNGIIRFKIIQYRLIMAAYFAAHECETSGNITKLLEILSGEHGYIPQKINQTDIFRPVDDCFDVYAVFGVALAFFLGPRLKHAYYDKLIALASDFDVNNRPAQIGAVYILSYILCELDLSSIYRERILNATYAKTLYPIQCHIFKYLTDTNQYYLTCIEKNLVASCSVHKGKASAQPFYLLCKGMVNYFHFKEQTVENLDAYICAFLAGNPYRNPEMYMSLCAYKQFVTWFEPISQENFKEHLYHIFTLFSMVFDRLTCLDEDIAYTRMSSSTLQYAYGVSLLGYALANIINRTCNENGALYSAVKKEIHSWLDDSAEKDRKIQFFTALVFSDYYIRMSNELYCTPGKKDDHNTMFIPCGAYRAQRALHHVQVDLPCSYRIRLPIKFAEAYINWLKEEIKSNFRYSWLMVQLIKEASNYHDGKSTDIHRKFFREIEGIADAAYKYRGLSFMSYDYYPG